MRENSKATAPITRGESAPIDKRSNWKLRLILGSLAVIIMLAIYAISTIFMPVWWATRISSQNVGSATGGWISGFSLGFVFTLVPLLVLWQIRYRKLSWRWRGAIAVLAIILALPNWLTLGIFWNGSDAAQKAQAILNTGATWFGGATLAGAISGATIFLIILITWLILRRRGARLKALEAQHETQRRSNTQNEAQ
ncbi:hypothetical protein [Glutamicibacter arilaitensis]|uniref:hypothetical protein n=1 Tax=Glutamicibacter arilaitensis TaxID=256701 RepID=UPI00384FAA9A